MVMSAPPPSRQSPFLQRGPRLPSLPIPIPARRVVTNPPPRSPDRDCSSPDLVFEMSPVALEESPLRHLGSTHHRHFGLNGPYISFARFAAPQHPQNGAIESLKPYPQEPFLYPIPKLPSRSSPTHARSQSEVISPSQFAFGEKVGHCPGLDGFDVPVLSLPCSPSDSPLGLEKEDPTSISYPLQDTLTSAFQNSVSSGTSSTTSTYPPSPPDSAPASPKLTASALLTDSAHASPANKLCGSSRSSVNPSAILRTSAAAAPVLSFAHAELDSTGMYTRTATTGSKPKSPTSCLHSMTSGGAAAAAASVVSRARSPYAFVRGRRNSVLRDRTLHFSDDDIAGTLKRDGVSCLYHHNHRYHHHHHHRHEKFGLEKYLPAGTHKRSARGDENVLGDVLVEKERGRTRSRARGPLRG